MNNYTEGKIKVNAKRELYYIYIEHTMLWGLAVFGNLDDLHEYQVKTRISLEKYAPLTLDKALTPPEGIIKAYTSENARLFSRIDNRQVYVLNE